MSGAGLVSKSSGSRLSVVHLLERRSDSGAVSAGPTSQIMLRSFAQTVAIYIKIRIMYCTMYVFTGIYLFFPLQSINASGI